MFLAWKLMFQVLKLMFPALKLVFPAWKHRLISYKKTFLAKPAKKIMQFIAFESSRNAISQDGYLPQLFCG